MAEISVADELGKILDEYEKDVQQIANKSISKVAKESVQKLKTTSPRRTGKYASGWTSKKEHGALGVDTVTVHNRQYQLTHLLENGHIVRNKKGEYGRAPAHPHIKPVEEWASSELPAEIESELNK